MTYSVVLSLKAQRDLIELYDYIAERWQAPSRYVHRPHPDVLPVAWQLSLRGTRRDDLKLGLRLIGFERRTEIAFQVKEDEVIIARVLYGGRDLGKAFRKH